MIVNFGSLNIDYVYAVHHFVKPGETLSSSGMSIYPGGKGLNQSIAIARAGGNVVHAGAYGRGGGFLCDILKESGVDVSQLKEMEEENGMLLFRWMSMPKMPSCSIGGTNETIDKCYIDEVMEGINKHTIVLLQNEITSVDYIIKRAKEKGCTVAFNPAPMKDKVSHYPLELVDILILNETEGEALSGK